VKQHICSIAAGALAISAIALATGASPVPSAGDERAAVQSTRSIGEQTCATCHQFPLTPRGQPEALRPAVEPDPPQAPSRGRREIVGLFLPL